LKGKTGYKLGERRKKREREGKEKREKQKEGVIFSVVSLLLLMGPIGRAGDRDVRHPWVLFVIGATCVPGQPK
jgi:hypothetical protein